jgi:hypothetical protein
MATVGELIQFLKQFDTNAPVILSKSENPFHAVLNYAALCEGYILKENREFLSHNDIDDADLGVEKKLKSSEGKYTYTKGAVLLCSYSGQDWNLTKDKKLKLEGGWE